MNNMIVYTNKYKIPFQIDEDDYEIVSRYSWNISNGYVTGGIRTYKEIDGIWQRTGGRTIGLVGFLLGEPANAMEWDHIDNDKMNNQRLNLRLVTHSVNLKNRRSWGVSGVVGVVSNGRYYDVWIPALRHPSGVRERIATGFKSVEDAIRFQQEQFILRGI